MIEKQNLLDTKIFYRIHVQYTNDYHATDFAMKGFFFTFLEESELVGGMVHKKFLNT